MCGAAISDWAAGGCSTVDICLGVGADQHRLMHAYLEKRMACRVRWL